MCWVLSESSCSQHILLSGSTYFPQCLLGCISFSSCLFSLSGLFAFSFLLFLQCSILLLFFSPHTHTCFLRLCSAWPHRCGSVCSNRYTSLCCSAENRRRAAGFFLICPNQTVREETQVEQEEKKKRGLKGGGKSLSFILSDAPLDTMLLCVDLVLRGKSLKWWKTTNSWHRGLMGPSSLPVRKWPTSALSSLPPAADWQSSGPAAPLPWRTTTSSTTTMTASTTGVSVTACAWACMRARAHA